MTMSDDDKNPSPPADPARLFTSLPKDKKARPVKDWNPPFCGDLPMIIRADGRWDYMNSPIARQALVELFASILRREGDDYFLVTPVEKVRITVEDAPFIAVELRQEGAGRDQAIHLRSNTGEIITIGPGHQLILRGTAEAARPYVHWRDGLWAKLSRSVYYELMKSLDCQGGRTGVWSGGEFFLLDDTP